MVAPTNYPRASGVLVPSSLLHAGCPVTENAQDADGRARVAAEVVAWVRRSFRRLPAELLDTELAEPEVILKSWIIGQRTRGSVERILSFSSGRSTRTVRDYLRAERLGFFGLVDLLAAREEESARVSHPRDQSPCEEPPQAARSSGSSGRLEDLSAFIRERLPLRAADLAQALATSDVVLASPTLDDIVRAYRERHLPVPFRVFRRGGAVVLVDPESISSAETLLTSAAHIVFQRGLSTLRAVVERLGALTTAPIEMKAASRILAAIPRLRWLDERAGWFSFADYSTRLAVAVRKVFAATKRVMLRELKRALAKQVELLATVPARTMEAYLVQIVGCEIVDGCVRSRRSLVTAPLGPSERAIVRALREKGGEGTMSALRARAARSGMTAATFRHLVATSPLVLEQAGRLRLVGMSPARNALFGAP